MDVGHNIKTNNGEWTFGNNNVVNNFVNHVSSSVPLYEQGHTLVCDLSEYFVRPNSVHYEIGSSTGELTKKIAERHSHKDNAQIIGVEIEDLMIKKAQEHCSGITNISFEDSDILDYDFKATDFIVSYYCIQFTQLSIRQLIIDKIYKSLNWGGAFLLFEKVRAPDARFQDISNSWYNSYKLQQGFTAESILAKTNSLKTVLEPFSTQGNIDMLKRSGFSDINSVFKFMCFEGFLAIK